MDETTSKSISKKQEQQQRRRRKIQTSSLKTAPLPPSLHQHCCRQWLNKKKVRFNTITIREYNMTLGDHPSCSCGPPITLDWTIRRTRTMTLNEYEKDRQNDNKHKENVSLEQQLFISERMRRFLLKCLGHSKEEMLCAEFEVFRIKQSRQLSSKEEEEEDDDELSSC